MPRLCVGPLQQATHHCGWYLMSTRAGWTFTFLARAWACVVCMNEETRATRYTGQKGSSTIKDTTQPLTVVRVHCLLHS